MACIRPGILTRTLFSRRPSGQVLGVLHLGGGVLLTTCLLCPEDLHFVLHPLTIEVALPNQALARLESHGGLLHLELHGGHELFLLLDRLLHPFHCCGQLRVAQCGFLQQRQRGAEALAVKILLFPSVG